MHGVAFTSRTTELNFSRPGTPIVSYLQGIRLGSHEGGGQLTARESDPSSDTLFISAGPGTFTRDLAPRKPVHGPIALLAVSAARGCLVAASCSNMQEIAL